MVRLRYQAGVQCRLLLVVLHLLLLLLLRSQVDGTEILITSNTVWR